VGYDNRRTTLLTWETVAPRSISKRSLNGECTVILIIWEICAKDVSKYNALRVFRKLKTIDIVDIIIIMM
jgi:hypothetical protein